jgi:hypothetical protein
MNLSERAANGGHLHGRCAEWLLIQIPKTRATICDGWVIASKHTVGDGSRGRRLLRILQEWRYPVMRECRGKAQSKAP